MEIFRQEIERILKPAERLEPKEAVLEKQAERPENKSVSHTVIREQEDAFLRWKANEEREKRRAMRDLNLY